MTTIVTVPDARAAVAAPRATARADGSRIETWDAVPGRGLEPRRVDVWLPPGYDTGTQRYAVLYMHDGQNLFDPASAYGGVTWGVAEAAARLMAAGRIRPVIVVGVWNTAARFVEYMPRKAAPAGEFATGVDVGRVPAGTRLLSDEYLRFLVHELKPRIDGRYRTEPQRDATFVMGSSMGGLISAYAIAEYPEVYGGAACVSTHWPAADGAMIDWLGAHLPDPATHRLYFDYGTRTLDAGYEPYQRRMDALLRARGYLEGEGWRTLRYEGAEHSERSWSARIDAPLEFLLAVHDARPAAQPRPAIRKP